MIKLVSKPRPLNGQAVNRFFIRYAEVGASPPPVGTVSVSSPLVPYVLAVPVPNENVSQLVPHGPLNF